jgi:hypothetical protein
MSQDRQGAKNAKLKKFLDLGVLCSLEFLAHSISLLRVCLRAHRDFAVFRNAVQQAALARAQSQASR